MKTLRKIIEINEELCNGCGACVPSCEEGAIKIVDGKAKLVADKYCDGLGACLGQCPTGAMRVVEREAEAFNEAAVAAHLGRNGGAAHAPAHPHAPGGGCPSARMQQFTRADQPAPQPSGEPAESALSHWPVQIRLVSPDAPFLDGADLLVAADCVPVAYARFHQDLLTGKVVMMGCPKFDDAQAYVAKFAEVFSRADIRSITVVVMQVPCCQSMPLIVQRALELAGKALPVEIVVISLQGEVIMRNELVA